VASFRATLEEVLSADLILHVRDISHKETEEQAEDVRTIMGELGVEEGTPQLEVWNKIDLLDEDDQSSVKAIAERSDDILAISAVTGAGVETLLEEIKVALAEKTETVMLTLTFAQGKARAWLFEQGIVQSERQTETGFELEVTWSAKQASRYAKLR